MAYIVIQDESGVQKKFEVESEATIGRHPSCEIVLEEGAVSRQHAKVVERGGFYLLEDLNSRNGTYLNNRLIHKATRLLDGDVIKICDQNFAFQLHDLPANASARRTTSSESSYTPPPVLIEDTFGQEMPSIMSQLEVASHHEASGTVSSPQARLDAMMEITRALAKTTSLEQVFPVVLDYLFDIFRQADRGFVVLQDPVRGLQPLGMKVRREQDEESIRISRTIVRHVMESQQAIISADATSDSRFDLAQSITDFRIRSLTCAPLIDSEGNSIGVIQLDTLRNAVGFSEEDLEILMTVALQAGLAIDNMNLYRKEMQQQALERDLELAHEVQHRLIPNQPPAIDQYQLYDYYRPAEKVGGDYFDYVVLDGNRLAIMVADVVGHGIAAALLMAKLSAESRFALATSPTASEAMCKLNRSIAGLQLDRFVTVILAIIEMDDHKCTFVNAGHMPPIIRKQEGETTQLDVSNSGLPVGIIEDYEYEQYQIDLQPGDVIALYTDGISETTNGDDDMYGNARVVECLANDKQGLAKTCGETLIRDVRQFSAGEKQGDDICLVVFGRNGD